MGRILAKTKEYFSRTSIHGLKFIFLNDSLINFFWIVPILLSATCCSYYVAQSIIGFSSFEITSIITTAYESQSQFPTISFCSTLGSFVQLPVLNCTFNLDDCKTKFESYTDVYHGKCYRFNSGIDVFNNSYPILASTIGGIRYGLKLDLNFSIKTNNDFNELAVLFHNSSLKPVNMLNKAYRLGSGSRNFFEIERVFDEKLDYPYNKCFKDANKFNGNRTLIDFIKSTNNSYDQMECTRFCRNLYTAEESGCNCIRTLENSADCAESKNSTIRLCYENYTKSFQKRNLLDLCSKYCPEECDKISFRVMQYSQQLPTSGKVNSSEFYSKYQEYNQIQKNFISISVYYVDLKYTHIKQFPKIEIFGLLSNIGGTFGLFLGASLISFIELIVYVIRTLVLICKFNKN